MAHSLDVYNFKPNYDEKAKKYPGLFKNMEDMHTILNKY